MLTQAQFANTQSIIVYRNPLEAYLWESGAASTGAFAFLVFIAVFLISHVILEWLPKRILPASIVRKYFGWNTSVPTYASLAIAAVSTYFIVFA